VDSGMGLEKSNISRLLPLLALHIDFNLNLLVLSSEKKRK
jgi:hypothetical protein